MATNFMFLRIKTKTTLVILFCFLSPIVSAISFTKIRLPKNVNDPEALAFKLRIPPFFIGIANGRILKYLGRTNGFVEFGFTTPNRWKLHSLNVKVGVRRHENCQSKSGLWKAIRDGIAPPIKSVVCLLCVFRIGVLGPRGGLVTQLSIAANGEPYPFCNGVDVHQHTGNVYFTDNTGVAVDEEEKIVMVTEFTANRTRKFTLQGGRSIIATIQPTPDNIKRTRLNKFGVAAARVDPRIDSGLLPTGVRINGNGTVLETVNPERWYGNKSGFEVQEFGTKLYIVSRLEDFIGMENRNRFCNAVCVHQPTGNVYFTDAGSTYEIKQVTALFRNLTFAAGVARFGSGVINLRNPVNQRTQSNLLPIGLRIG
ncbi:hypothetical protein GOBAR_AA18422 [Gossypium barbadense]|uniref:Strictosidine synthase conserved region domain-containing protein n=1 Tax=Gossypium barbadense TaxID=3634 RepID=A0A2P5XFX9_GOSBA|nr:hypothetical protein GOBAR_AA18422 [Gossypium barbadense]